MSRQPASGGNWSPPPAWSPPPGWGPPPGVAWGQGWPGWTPVRRSRAFNWSRLPATLVVAAIVAAVVLGGIGVDGAVAAPSAGTVSIGGVTLTAAPGWVEVTPDDPSFGGVELRKASAVLTAESSPLDQTRDSAGLLEEQRQMLDGEVAQASYGDPQTTSINGHATSSLVFEATVTSGGQTGVIDGELICMVVEDNAVVILVAARQGQLDPVIDDVGAMLRSVEVAR